MDSKGGSDKMIVGDFTVKDDALILQMNNGGSSPFSLRLTRVQKNTWRLQSAAEGLSFNDMGAAQILARDLGEPVPNNRLSFSVRNKRNELIIELEGNRLSCVLSPFSLSAKNIKNGTDAASISGIRMENSDFIVKGSLQKPAKEALFGGGERFNHANQRGKRIDILSLDIWAETEGNSYTPVPMVLSSRGYALFLNRYERSVLDLGAEDEETWTFTQLNAPLDLYLFINENPAHTLKDYSELTGFAPMPAPWLFGIQVSRHLILREFSTVQGIEAMIAKMEEHDFSWDAIIAEGWDTYNPDTYKDLKQIVDKVHSLGKKFLLYEPCGRVPYSDEKEKQKKIFDDLHVNPEFLVKEPDGNYRLPETATDNPADAPESKRSQFIDITNPEALTWWHDFVWGRLVREIGVDGCKIDFCEQVPDHIPLCFHDGRDYSGAHLWYPTLYNTLMYRYFNQYRPNGGMNFSRGGGIGAQRYPFIWAGDQLREFRFLQAVLTSILSSGLSGIPFMSYDMAGYRPARDMENNSEEKVFIRGTEMSCFSSNMQTHGTVSRPYDFEAPIRDIYRNYANLHQLLRPYLVEQAETACKTGMPLLRHLFLYAPRDINVWHIEDEYMIGEALLAAPVFSTAEERDIYLPRGTWRNILNGGSYTGDQTLHNFPVPFHQIPVFLLEKNGSKTIDKVLEEAKEILNTLSR
jgi:alpha-D-xyloside xylohydrolase